MIFILFFSKNRQSVFTKLPVLFFLLGKNLDSCDSGLSCSLSYCFCHSFCDSLIEGIRDDVVSGDLVIRDQICDGVGSSHFHLVVDIRCAYIQSSAENTRESQNIVDLVREIAAAGANNSCASLPLPSSGMISGVGVCAWRRGSAFVSHGLHHLLGVQCPVLIRR